MPLGVLVAQRPNYGNKNVIIITMESSPDVLRGRAARTAVLLWIVIVHLPKG